MRRFHPLFCLLALLAGCQGADADKIGNLVWAEAMDLPVGTILGIYLRDVVLGAVFGFVIAVAAFFLIARRGWYRVEFARFAILAAILIFMMIGGTVVGALLGNMQAGLDIAHVGLRETSIGKKAIPAIADMGADVVAMAEQVVIQGKGFQEVDVVEFEAGKPVAVVELIEHLNQLKNDIAQKLAHAVIDKTIERNPDWKDGVTERAARWTLPLLAEYLADEHVRRQMAKVGIPDFLGDLLAHAKGHANGAMTREQLSLFFRERVVAPALISPIRGLVRKTQAVTLAVAILGALAPIAVIEVVRFFGKKMKGGSSASGSTSADATGDGPGEGTGDGTGIQRT